MFVICCTVSEARSDTVSLYCDPQHTKCIPNTVYRCLAVCREGGPQTLATSLAGLLTGHNHLHITDKTIHNFEGLRCCDSTLVPGELV